MTYMLHNVFILFKIRNFNLALAFGLMSFFFFSTSSFAEEEKKSQLQVLLTKKQAFQIAFPGADEIKKERFWLDKEQIRTIEEIFMYKIHETRFTFYTGIKNGKPIQIN